MRNILGLIGMAAAFISLPGTPAYSLSCMNDIGFEQILISGNVVEVFALGDIGGPVGGERVSEYLKKRPANASVANVVVEKVLKGGIQKGDTVQVIVTAAWNGTSEGRRIPVSSGPIFIGGSRDRDGNIWWSDCYTIRLNDYAEIEWDESPEEAWEGNRGFLRIWNVAKEYDAILAGRSPAAISQEERDKAEATLNKIKDYDRILDFYRRRYFVKPSLVDGVSLAFAAVKLRDLESARNLLSQVKSFYGVSDETRSVENTIELLEGRAAPPPFKSLSDLWFNNGLFLSGVNLENQSITGASASFLRAEGTSFKGATIADFQAYEGDLTGADFSKAQLRNVELGGRRYGADKFLLAARKTLFRSTYLEGVRATGDFSYSDFAASSGKNITFQGDFERATFDHSRFERAEFNGGSFRDASFKGIRFKDASFRNVDLRGADFTGAEFEGETVWYDVKFDDQTRWPNGNFSNALRQVEPNPTVIIYP